jgi:hypothetical protein
MTQETRAKKDKCTLVVSVDGDKLRILGASDEPLIILKGQICELRESGGQVHVIQRDAGPWENQTPSPPDPYEDSDTDFATPVSRRTTAGSVGRNSKVWPDFLRNPPRRHTTGVAEKGQFLPPALRKYREPFP